MLHIQRIICNMFQENCYIVSDDTKQCVIIDCGAHHPNERKAITSHIAEGGLKPVHLLATHAHIDHNFGNNTILEAYGLHPEVAMADKPLMGSLRQQASAFAGIDYEEDIPEAGLFFSKGQQITFGNHTLSIIPTPGHTPGSVVFYCEEEKVAFTGDTLFQGSIGRTDFEMGSYLDMCNSLRTLASALPADVTVLPGHGPQTTMGEELQHNPYLK